MKVLSFINAIYFPKDLKGFSSELTFSIEEWFEKYAVGDFWI